MVLGAIDQGSLPWVFPLSLLPPGVNCASPAAALSLLFEPPFLFSLPLRQALSLALLSFPLLVLAVRLVVSLPVRATLSSHVSFSLPFHLSCLSAWTLPNLSSTVTSHLCRLHARNCLYQGEMLFFLLVWWNLFCRVLVTKPKALMLCFLGK